MNWIALIVAGLFEIGWPLGFKMSQQPGSNKFLWIIVAVVCMGISGGLLWWAQKTIPIGTAYAVWTGMGAVGTLLVGVFFFGDTVSTLKLIAVSFIIIRIIGLKLA